jgi:acyl-coenzyme A synthetase/AMP-(fatty) acid ligase
MSEMQVPASFNFAADVLHRQARETPDAIATIEVARDRTVRTWTYRQASDATGRLAAALAAAGIRKGDRVLIFMPRTALWQIAMSACFHIGAIPVPCVTQITAPELAYRAQQCGARGAISADEFVERFAGITQGLVFRASRGKGGQQEWQSLEEIVGSPAAPPPAAEMPADAPALMYFTSGSSGMPKAVMHAARGVYVRGWQPWRQLGVGSADVIWTTSDTGWTRAGSCLLFGPWASGATALMVEPALSAAERLDMLVAQRVTVFCAVSTELRQILAQAPSHPLPHLRATLSAGEAMTAELAHGWKAFSGIPLVVGYGQTETPTSTLTDADAEPANGMIGKPMAGNRVTVVDERGIEAGAGVPGEIVFAGSHPGLMLGYWRDGAVAQALERDDWHRTGDCGYLDEAGNLYFVGRSDDIISSSGYRIGPTEVENALARHQAVAECAVAASPDPVRGEIVKAFVVLKAGCAPSEALAAQLQEFVKGEVAPYKYPRRIDFVSELPRTSSGKISRRMLREAEYDKRG